MALLQKAEEYSFESIEERMFFLCKKAQTLFLCGDSSEAKKFALQAKELVNDVKLTKKSIFYLLLAEMLSMLDGLPKVGQ